jgi:hypothetical protein
MDKFLYGASVQGIQSFIFQTNKLKEIVGGSELIEQICTVFFKSEVGINYKEENLIVGAAGNIKYLFEDEEECKRLVRLFPRFVMTMAPGITICQAVVKINNIELSEALEELELKLKVQRNRLSQPLECGFMALERSRRTGGVGFVIRKKRKGGIEVICEATDAKRKATEKDFSADQNNFNETLFSKVKGDRNIPKQKLAFDIENITESGNNNWIAVIHADGNGIGKVIQGLGKVTTGRPDDVVQMIFKKFSRCMEEATINSVQAAFNGIDHKKYENYTYPLRPIILGGDDLTIIIRADLALDFAEVYLKTFEAETKRLFAYFKTDYAFEGLEEGLTACAGISFVKESYPFHYAVKLSELLCEESKVFVKEMANRNPRRVESALSFFKVQDSYIEDDLHSLKSRTLHTGTVSLYYGPYLLHSSANYASLGQLKEKLNIVNEEASNMEKGKATSKLRQWITELYKDPTTANFILDRMKIINKDFYDRLKMDRERGDKTIIYDVLQLHQLNY